MRLLAAFLAISLLATDVDARGRLFGRRRSTYTYYNYTNYGYSFSGSVQEIAEQKAALLAECGYGFHPGGYTGNYEGWGMGATAESAKWSTCNGGNCLSARGCAQAWSERAGCWFAINIW